MAQFVHHSWARTCALKLCSHSAFRWKHQDLMCVKFLSDTETSQVSTTSELTQDSAVDQLPRRPCVKNVAQAHWGSRTILGGLICTQQQQVAFWEDQDEGQFLRVKSNLLLGSEQQVWPEESRQAADLRTTSWTQLLCLYAVNILRTETLLSTHDNKFI